IFRQGSTEICIFPDVQVKKRIGKSVITPVHQRRATSVSGIIVDVSPHFAGLLIGENQAVESSTNNVLRSQDCKLSVKSCGTRKIVIIEVNDQIAFGRSNGDVSFHADGKAGSALDVSDLRVVGDRKIIVFTDQQKLFVRVRLFQEAMKE